MFHMFLALEACPGGRGSGHPRPGEADPEEAAGEGAGVMGFPK